MLLPETWAPCNGRKMDLADQHASMPHALHVHCPRKNWIRTDSSFQPSIHQNMKPGRSSENIECRPACVLQLLHRRNLWDPPFCVRQPIPSPHPWCGVQPNETSTCPKQREQTPEILDLCQLCNLFLVFTWRPKMRNR